MFAFGSDDPNFTLNFRGVDLKDESVIRASFDISPLPDNIAADLPQVEGSQGLIGKLKKVVKKNNGS